MFNKYFHIKNANYILSIVFLTLQLRKYFLHKKYCQKKANVPSSVNGITFVRRLIEPVSVHIRLHPISVGNNECRLV